MRVSQLLVLLSLAGTITVGCAEDAPTTAEAALASAHNHPGMDAAVSGDPTIPGGFSVQPLARGGFPDQIDATFRVKLDRATNVVHVQDPSDVLVAKITFEPGGSIGWHTHPGPAIATVASGALTIVNANGCLRRVYQAGQAFVDPGQGNVHIGYNDTAGETIVYVTYLDVPVGGPATTPAADPGCAL